jgi:CheY-like chemotaxis protein
LIVDDEADLREILSEDLAELGAEVFNAQDGRRAFDLAFEIRPDIIVSDMRMPGGDGFELIKRLKSQLLTPAPFIFLMTGYTDVGEDEALSMGVHGVLSKPFALQVLRRLIITTLSAATTA